MLLPALIFPFVRLAGCNHIVVLAMIISAGGLVSFTIAGYMVNHIDLANNFSGRMFFFT